MHGRIVWTATIAGLAAAETWGIRHPASGWTLSELTRLAFRTHHPIGRIVFVLGWALLTRWFVPHVLREVVSS